MKAQTTTLKRDLQNIRDENNKLLEARKEDEKKQRKLMETQKAEEQRNQKLLEAHKEEKNELEATNRLEIKKVKSNLLEKEEELRKLREDSKKEIKMLMASEKRLQTKLGEEKEESREKYREAEIEIARLSATEDRLHKKLDSEKDRVRETRESKKRATVEDRSQMKHVELELEKAKEDLRKEKSRCQVFRTNLQERSEEFAMAKAENARLKDDLSDRKASREREIERKSMLETRRVEDRHDRMYNYPNTNPNRTVRKHFQR